MHDSWRYGSKRKGMRVPFDQLQFLDAIRSGRKRGRNRTLPPDCAIPGCQKSAHQWSRHRGQSMALCTMHSQRVNTDSLFVPGRLIAPLGKGTVSRGYRFFSINGKKVPEHRLVMEQTLGRPLRSDEHVHHRNAKRLDNRPENLMVLSNHEHKLLHYRIGWRIHEFSLDALKQLRSDLDSLITKIQNA
jgi:hypothetical protein